MIKNNLTYEDSGVNIKAADKFVKFISTQTKKTKKKGKFDNIGGFGALNRIPKGFRSPHIVTSTDGVGTKIEIANIYNKFDTIGIDLVAMCVNDLIVQGAKPFVFLDYISINKFNQKKLRSIIKGIVKGCITSDCELAGGETAEMPGTYAARKFDIAGFAVGLVEKEKILRKEKVKNENVILAVPSSGLHSNGFSLVRYILNKKKIKLKNSKFLKKELLRPTKIYTKEILKINKKNLLNSCANITGGGIIDNIKRIIPDGLCANIYLNKIKVLKIFKYLKNFGIQDKEMLKTFNCGVGFCLVVNKKNVHKIKKFFNKQYQPYIIGKITKGNKKFKVHEKINWI